jgi:hypothetical protein
LPFSSPAIQFPFSIAATQVPFSIPTTQVPFSIPATQVAFSIPVTQVPFSIPATQVPFSIPATQVPFSIPATKVPFSTHATQLSMSNRPIRDAPSAAKRPRTLSVPQRKKSSLVPATNSMTFVPHLSISSFLISPEEKREGQHLLSQALSYVTQKNVIEAENIGMLKPFKLLVAETSHASAEQSNIVYMDILDENADSDETMLQIAEKLLEDMHCCDHDGYVIVVGDGKTYDHLLKIKRVYGEPLKKLLIFPGDWHTLKNYQLVLMKIYYHCGLKEQAKASGFRAETLSSLEKCSNFKRTHYFLLSVWEATYRCMVKEYLQQSPLTNLSTRISNEVQHLQKHPAEILGSITIILNTCGFTDDFRTYTSRMAALDDTWKFWAQFVVEDCFAYISLWL